jgi:hypothetical protein
MEEEEKLFVCTSPDRATKGKEEREEVLELLGAALGRNSQRIIPTSLAQWLWGLTSALPFINFRVAPHL